MNTTPFITSLMISDTSEEAGVMSLFAESVWSAAERELGIDEKVTVRSLSQDTPFIPNLKMVVRKGKECVREYLEHVNGGEGTHSDTVIRIAPQAVRMTLLWTSWKP